MLSFYRVAVLSLTVSGIPAAAAVPDAVVGQVIDAAGGPLNANVRCIAVSGSLSVSRVAGADGLFTCGSLPTGEYMVEASPLEKGFANVLVGPMVYRFPDTLGITIIAPAIISTRNSMTVTTTAAQPGLVAGELGKEIGALRIELCFVSREASCCEQINEFGQYLLALPIGAYRMTARIDDMIIVDKNIRVSTPNVMQWEPLSVDDVTSALEPTPNRE